MGLLPHSLSTRVWWAQAVRPGSQVWVCQEMLASTQGMTGLLPAIPIEALVAWGPRTWIWPGSFHRTHTVIVHFNENFLLAFWIETGIYLPGRMIPSYFCWNQCMASSLLILCLAPMQPVLRFLSAMLKPGLPSTCPRNNQQSPSQLKVKSRQTRLTHWRDSSPSHPVAQWTLEQETHSSVSDGTVTSSLEDTPPYYRFALEARLAAPPRHPHLTSNGS